MAGSTAADQALGLLFILLAISDKLLTGALADGITLRKAALGGVSRKLLQGAAGSTVFGDPPPGTLVVTWNLIPAKTVGGAFPYGAGAQPPPYQYDWFNTNPENCPGCANIIMYPVSAYVAGAGGQQTQLTSTGGCDVTSTEVADIGTLFSSCSGSFAVPNGGTLTVNEIWDFLQLPPGVELQVPTPFGGFNCTFFLSGPSPVSPDYGSFAAAFDVGRPIPTKPPTPNTLPRLFGNVGFETEPFNEQGTLSFQSINLRVKYAPAVQISGLAWNFPYSYCVFDSAQLKAQTAPQQQPTATTCDPRSVNSNKCYGSEGDQFVCCPGNCGPSARIPTCAPSVCSSPGAQPKGGTCDPTSANPNQCFNGDGSCYVCCPRNCGNVGPEGPTCAA